MNFPVVQFLEAEVDTNICHCKSSVNGNISFDRCITFSHYPEICCRISFLRMDEQGKQNWVPEEENGCVISHKVPDPIFCVELYGKSTGIPATIRMEYKTGEVFILKNHQFGINIIIIKHSSYLIFKHAF
jgi:hypothetical protein